MRREGGAGGGETGSDCSWTWVSLRGDKNVCVAAITLKTTQGHT